MFQRFLFSSLCRWLLVGVFGAGSVASAHTETSLAIPSATPVSTEFLTRALDTALNRLDQRRENSGPALTAHRHLLTDLRSNISRLRFLSVHAFSSDPRTQRRSAFFDRDQGLVYYVGDLVGSELETTALALHESLGALGVLDDNYQLSFALTLASLGEETKELPASLRARVLESLDQFIADAGQWISPARPYPNLLVAGGGTVVGGGGDIAELRLKLNFARFLFARADERLPLYLRLIAMIGLRIDHRLDPAVVEISPVLRPRVTSHPDPEPSGAETASEVVAPLLRLPALDVANDLDPRIDNPLFLALDRRLSLYYVELRNPLRRGVCITSLYIDPSWIENARVFNPRLWAEDLGSAAFDQYRRDAGACGASSEVQR